VLGSEPDNAEALGGIQLIEEQVRSSIANSVEANSLSEANRLLSRANRAGLHIDNIPSADNIAERADTRDSSVEDERVTAIDKDLSPFLKRQIAEIEQRIENGDADAAAALFEETDKFLPDPAISANLQQRIQNLRESAPSIDADAGSLANGPQNPANTSTNTDLDSITIPTSVPAITIGTGADAPYPNAEILARSAQTFDVDPSQTGPDTNETSEVNQLETERANSPDARNNSIPAITRPVSAPRRSYIEGTGEAAQHLNQLRSAIEAKSINRVLQISDDLPKERVVFLQQMFNRYDRVDVIINKIRDQSGQLTANLNVSMFNQRRDGSYYSAGRWNDVTVRAVKADNNWQKIKW